MQDYVRGIFALLCLLCAITILTSAWLEMVRIRRGESLLKPRHFRLRLLSAVIWTLILLSVAGGVTVWWPATNATKNQQVQFVALMNGALWLIMIGLLLLMIDMWMLSSARRRVEREQTIRFADELRELAEKETLRLRSEQTGKSTKVRAYAPQNGTGNAQLAADKAEQPSPTGLGDSHE